MFQLTAAAPRFANKLRSNTALVIGGTSGVGLSIAAALIEQGVNVILSSSRQSRLDEAIDLLRETYPSSTAASITGFTCDLSSTSDVETNLAALRQQVQKHVESNLDLPNTTTDEEQEEGTKIDHLVYTAGDRLPTVPISEVTPDKFHAALQVRALAALLSVKTFLPLLRESHTSTITRTSGSIAEKPIPGGWTILSFISAGLTGLTRQLALDLAPIRVNCVAPGVVDTDVWSSMDPGSKQAMFDDLQKRLPTNQVPGPDDIAESYIHLMRDRNVTGTVTHTNGGVFLV